MTVKEVSEKAGLKLNIQKPKIMISGPITSWQKERETVEMVTHYFLGLQTLQVVTAAMKLRRSVLGRKAMSNRDSMLRSRGIT